MTLDYFTKDQTDKSNCSVDCLAKWPPFLAEEFELPEGFNNGVLVQLKEWI
jgi:predicted lipoprotein with Yx(FWY)xxD motif